MNPLMTFLDAIRDHLDLHHLPSPVALRIGSTNPVTAQLHLCTLPRVAAGLLAWSASLDEVTASIWRTPDGDSVHLSIAGRMPSGVPVEVFDAVTFDPATFPDLPPNTRQDMPVFVLRCWTASGEVAA